GTEGYYQPIRFDARQLIDDQSSIALVRDGNVQPLERADATMNSRVDDGAVEAPMVFVGYGIRIPEAKYDELAGIDLKGKIAVYVNASGPVDAPGPVKSHAGSGTERWNALRAAGAIGIATIMNPRAPVGTNPQGTAGQTDASGSGRGAATRAPQRSFLLA